MERLSEAQTDKLLALMQILPDENDLEEVKKAPIRHNFDENSAALELMIPSFDHQTSNVEVSRQLSVLSVRHQNSIRQSMVENEDQESQFDLDEINGADDSEMDEVYLSSTSDSTDVRVRGGLLQERRDLLGNPSKF